MAFSQLKLLSHSSLLLSELNTIHFPNAVKKDKVECTALIKTSNIVGHSDSQIFFHEKSPLNSGIKHTALKRTLWCFVKVWSPLLIHTSL